MPRGGLQLGCRRLDTSVLCSPGGLERATSIVDDRSGADGASDDQRVGDGVDSAAMSRRDGRSGGERASCPSKPAFGPGYGALSMGERCHM